MSNTDAVHAPGHMRTSIDCRRRRNNSCRRNASHSWCRGPAVPLAPRARALTPPAVRYGSVMETNFTQGMLLLPRHF